MPDPTVLTAATFAAIAVFVATVSLLGWRHAPADDVPFSRPADSDDE